MHKSALALARAFHDAHVAPLIAKASAERPLVIGEFGSMDVNGTIRPIFEHGHTRYIGFDIAPGKGVDVVLAYEDARLECEQRERGEWERVPARWVDVWLSCSTLEHVRHPWRAVRRMSETMKPGALSWWCIPWRWPYHGFPLDCWRVLPDGMSVLLEEAGLEPIACEFNPQGDCIGIGRKPA